MRNRLNLPDTPGGIFEPGGGNELLLEFSAFRVVGGEFVELALQALSQETGDEQTKLCLTTN